MIPRPKSLLPVWLVLAIATCQLGLVAQETDDAAAGATEAKPADEPPADLRENGATEPRRGGAASPLTRPRAPRTARTTKRRGRTSTNFPLRSARKVSQPMPLPAMPTCSWRPWRGRAACG